MAPCLSSSSAELIGGGTSGSFQLAKRAGRLVMRGIGYGLPAVRQPKALQRPMRISRPRSASKPPQTTYIASSERERPETLLAMSVVTLNLATPPCHQDQQTATLSGAMHMRFTKKI